MQLQTVMSPMKEIYMRPWDLGYAGCQERDFGGSGI